MLISRSGKATGNYKNAWKTELDNETIKSINFEYDVTTVDFIQDNTISQQVEFENQQN